MSDLFVANPKLTEFIWRRIGSFPPTSYSVGWMQDGEPLGGFIVDRYTGRGGSCWIHFAGLPGWLTRQKMEQLAAYVYGHLDCGVAYGVVEADNQAVISIDRKVGFKAVFPLVGHFAGGKDGLLLEMKREDCRWFREQ